MGLTEASKISNNHQGLDAAWEQVRQFHEAFHHPVSDQPTLIEPERAKTRMSWIQEEVQEFLDADSIVDQADAMIDVMYFALGTLVEMGVQPQALMDIVQQANMSKLGPDGKPIYGPDGKVKKPESWENPYEKLQAAIQQQHKK